MSRKVDKVATSMIALGPKPHISPRAIKADLTATWPDMVPLGTAKKTDKNILTFDIGQKAQTFLTLVAAPIPWSDLEGPCATSLLWKDAATVLKDHKAFVLVTMTYHDELSQIEKSKLLTQVTASILHTCDAALGVLWCNAALVIQPALFREYAVKILPVGPPIHIWIDFRIGPNEHGKMAGYTTGLEALGHMEIETDNAPESTGELRARIESLIVYLLQNGPVIRDGDTIGGDANERIRAVYSPSAFGHEGTVMRLDFEA